MHRQNGLCAGRDGGLDFVRVDVVMPVRLHEHGRRAVDGNAHHAGDVCVGAHDHLIARADIQKPERQNQRVQPAGQSNAVLCARIGGKLLFKSLYFIAQNVPAAAQHLCCLLFIFRCVQLKLPPEIIRRDHRHHGSLQYRILHFLL